MGGTGSGRPATKTCTDRMRSLDVRVIARSGYLQPGNSVSWKWMRDGTQHVSAYIDVDVEDDKVLLNYRQRTMGGAWVPMRYAVNIDWTACNFGGRRAWWQCPAPGCSRRVAVLYGGTMFACRRCHELAYRCQREAEDDRATRRAETVRRRLGWAAGLLSFSGGKPKGMHWRTYWRLQVQHDETVCTALAGIRVK